MGVEKYYEKLKKEGHSFEKCNLHYCIDWDELPVCECLPESESCGCKFETSSEGLNG